MLFGIWLLFWGMWVTKVAGQQLTPPIADGNSAETCLLITEIYYHATLDDVDHEWIELTNRCDQPLDIADYKLGDAETPGDREGMTRFPNGTTLAARQSVVVARSAAGFQVAWGSLPDYELRETNGGVPVLESAELSSGEIALANGGDEVILLDADNALVDGISYGDSDYLLIDAVARGGKGESLERIWANCDADSSADFQVQSAPTPQQAQFADACPTNAHTAANTPPIGTIQGDGPFSPQLDQRVAFEGVVTGIQEDRNSRGQVFYTVFVQDLVGREDGNPQTSDGLPVFVHENEPDVRVGDHVLVRGEVIEYFDLTEISSRDVRIDVLGQDNPLPSPIEIDPQTTDLEALEGMRVRLDFAPARVVGATFSGCGFTVVRQDSGVERIYRRHIDDPIGAALPVLFRSDVDCADFPNVKVGDEISGLSGILIYNFEQYKLLVQDTSDLIVDSAPYPPLPQLPAPTADQFSVVSLNVENLFDGIDDTGESSEPKLSAEMLQTKLTKLSHTLTDLLHCPTIVALQEVEKQTLSEQLAAEAQAGCGFLYEVIHLESADARGIDLAYLVDGRRVDVISAELSQTCTPINTGIDDPTINCSNNEQPLFSRPPLVLTAQIDGQPITLVNNHFKSKRGGERQTAPRREAQAAHLRDLASTQLAQNPDVALIILGDFNDYEDSPPMQILADGGFVNALKRVPDVQRYSFVFSGVSQLIDGVFVSPALEPTLAHVSILHTNADYPDSLGGDLSAETIAYKSTDHDLPYVIFELGVEGISAETSPPSAPAPIIEPTAQTNATEPQNDPSSNSLALILGGVGLMGLAGGVGFWFGRKRA